MNHSSSTLKLIIISCVVATVAGAISCCAMTINKWELLCRPLLLGYLSCWLVAMGSACVLALGNLTGGHWAAATRPFYRAALNTFPFLVLLFVVIALNLSQIYPWAFSYGGAHESMPVSKAEYLSPNFLLARAVCYHLLWAIVWIVLSRTSRPDLQPASTPAMRRAGALSLVILALTTTFATFDWAMSLEPHWYSSIYGALLTAGGVVAAAALAIITLAIAARGADTLELPSEGQIESVPIGNILNDLGNLLLSYVMLSTYFAFSQFLIIWSGNLPEEISWYERRMTGGWGVAGLAVVAFFFVVPFLMLLWRDGKRRATYMSTVASIVIAAYSANMFWTIVPAFAPSDVRSIALNACALITIGSIWLALYFLLVGRALTGSRQFIDATMK